MPRFMIPRSRPNAPGTIVRQIENPSERLAQKNKIFLGPKGILFIREGGLGDILMCTPVIKKLKQKWNFPLSFATSRKFFPLLEGNLHIDHLLDIENLDIFGYGPVFDLRNQLENYSIPRNKLHRIDSIASFCNVKIDDYSIQLPDYEREKSWAKRETSGQKRLIGLAPQAHFRLRSWLEIYSRDLIEMMPKHSFILFGGNDEKHCWRHPRVALAIGLDLVKVLALMSMCDIFVTVDSGLLHFAGPLKIPTVALFGSLPPELRIKYYPSVQAIVPKNIPCCPCFEWQEKSQEDRDYCRDVDVRCMRAIKPWMVRNKILKLEKKIGNHSITSK